MAYAEFMRGYRITASGDASTMDKASHHLTNAVTRDPAFALAHATLSFACTTAISNSTRPACGWRRPNSTAGELSKLMRTFPKDTWPGLFCSGDHEEFPASGGDF